MSIDSDIGLKAQLVSDPAAVANGFFVMFDAAALAHNANFPLEPPAPELRKVPTSLVPDVLQAGASASIKTQRRAWPPLVGDLHLLVTDPVRQVLIPGGADRNVFLPADAGANQYFRVKHGGGLGTLFLAAADGSYPTGEPGSALPIYANNYAEFVFNATTGYWEIDG